MWLLLLACARTPPSSPVDSALDGHALFTRTWTVGDPLARPGDGLGPVFNGQSCAECHNQGGAGGGGARPVRLQTGATRNPTALWGAGLLDRVSAKDIEAVAAAPPTRFPEIHGQPGRDVDGVITRFGWKGDVAHLQEFVARACAFELGLEVPGGHQLLVLHHPLEPALDLRPPQFDALVHYVASLPPPQRTDTQEGQAGLGTFVEIGCSGCHSPDIGPAKGAYTDLLRHDMGTALADASLYYGTPRLLTDRSGVKPEAWRTPPLWGVRDSAPYLHDGRAPTIEAAIRAHDGEAQATRARFIALGPERQRELLDFLELLSVPM